MAMSSGFSRCCRVFFKVSIYISPMVKPYVMGLSYHKWLEMAVVLFFLAFPGMDVGNPLPASVLNASMKTRGVDVIRVRSIMPAVPQVIETQRRPGPKDIPYGIPEDQWPTVLHRVLEHKESLRRVADDYGVSHETIRRMVRVAHKL